MYLNKIAFGKQNFKHVLHNVGMNSLVAVWKLSKQMTINESDPLKKSVVEDTLK